MDYYVAPPGTKPNQFASFYATFSKARAPWANELRRRRIKETSPEQREKILAQYSAGRAAVLESIEANRQWLLETDQARMDDLIKMQDNIRKAQSDQDRSVKILDSRGRPGDDAWMGTTGIMKEITNRKDLIEGSLRMLAKDDSSQWGSARAQIKNHLRGLAKNVQDKMTNFDQSKKHDAMLYAESQLQPLLDEYLPGIGEERGREVEGIFKANFGDMVDAIGAKRSSGVTMTRRRGDLPGMTKDDAQAVADEMAQIKARMEAGYSGETAATTEQMRLITAMRDMGLAQMEAPVSGRPGEAWRSRNPVLSLEDFFKDEQAEQPSQEPPEQADKPPTVPAPSVAPGKAEKKPPAPKKAVKDAKAEDFKIPEYPEVDTEYPLHEQEADITGQSEYDPMDIETKYSLEEQEADVALELAKEEVEAKLSGLYEKQKNLSNIDLKNVSYRELLPIHKEKKKLEDQIRAASQELAALEG